MLGDVFLGDGWFKAATNYTIFESRECQAPHLCGPCIFCGMMVHVNFCSKWKMGYYFNKLQAARGVKQRNSCVDCHEGK